MWNWQQKDWPDFTYSASGCDGLERRFLSESALFQGMLEAINHDQCTRVTVDLISEEAYKTSEIEGEFLNRASLRSSIASHFGLKQQDIRLSPLEAGTVELMLDVYQHYAQPLTHETFYNWHLMLTSSRRDLICVGQYRQHSDTMQIVSGYIGERQKVHFEAPPSASVFKEMDAFITWFNDTAEGGRQPLPPLVRASIIHLYFESIHPFEDGNGRIGRALVEMALSQLLNRPAMIALSLIIQEQKKMYYAQLHEASISNHIDPWIEFFSGLIVEAQERARALLKFVIKKGHFFEHYCDELNERETKVMKRLFREGLKGFEGGLSANNYIRIAKTSRATATRDLQHLVSIGALSRTGMRKSTRYYLNFPVGSER